jgi:membrane associated rhomboid family serine protease
VECVRAASAGAPRGRGAFGGRPRYSASRAGAAFGGRPNGSAVVTWSIMAVNVVVFLAEVARPTIMYNLSMLSVTAVSPFGVATGVASGAWYRLLTSAFTAPGTSLSGVGLLDIALNMWCLYILGPQLEMLLGRARYLAVYLLSAVGGSVLYFYLAPVNQPAAGASGAIFGLFAAWFVMSRRLRADSSGILVLIVINLVFSFVWSAIAWQDHVGGLITGALITAAYAYAPRKNRVPIQITATVALIVLMVIAVMIRSHQLTA